MVGDEARQALDGGHGEDERGDEAHREDRDIIQGEDVAALVNIQDGGGQHGGDGEEEGQFGGRLAG